MKILLFILAFFYSLLSFSQTSLEKGLASINKVEAERYIQILANDSMQGRKAGQPGGKMAAEYLKASLKDIGIESWQKDYIHPFNMFRDLSARTGKPIPFSKNGVDTAKLIRSMDMQNVLGYIEGKNRNEIIVIGAHYDHLGINNKLKGDTIFNGADDNASGVAAVLQIAKAFLISGEQPKRSIIFAFFDGEERGLLGSSNFVRKISADSLIKIKGFINCDMIGRGKSKKVTYFASDDKPVFKQWIKDDIEKYQLQLKPNFRSLDKLVGISDHNSFASKNIPIIFYHTEIHKDYHEPTDHADRLDYDKVIEITKAGYLTLWRMINSEDF